MTPEPQKTVADIMTPTRRSPLLLIIAFVIPGLLVAAAFYLAFSKSAITAAQDQVDRDTATLKTEIGQLQSQKIEAAQLAKQWLQAIEKDEVRWSKVITAVQDLIPVDPVTQSSKFTVLSYSGSPGGKLNFNVETVPAQDAPFGDLAELVKIFNSSSFFKEAYVPSLTRGVTENSNTILSFVFNVVYSEEIKPEPITAPLEILDPGTVPTTPDTTPAVTTDTTEVTPAPVKVPRQ